MYDPPGYLWAIIIAGITAIPAATSATPRAAAAGSPASHAR
jgi:hypothetical protein